MDATATPARVLNINVGVLGHVDSGKTSLVKALSTSLSTAALDKSSQSQQRGITLDLGFSAFSMTIPPHLTEAAGDLYDSLQFTLVDCPGHASLIKTIIGGAQIIDMIVLVIDINKGIQTQTAECIVIGEITTEKMIIVLNKVDMIPLEEREERIEKMKNKLRKVFASTKFVDPQFILTSAAVGGEKVAAVVPSSKDSTGGGGGSGGGKSSKGGKGSAPPPQVETHGVDVLIEAIRSSIQMPRRNYDGPFYFAIDHCFPIKGHGTVLTGTILSGSIQINSTVELPLLQQQRKVKSMQMFRKPVKAARQGDRLGMCVANLDASLVERGIATTPNSVPLLSTVICLVKKVRFFKFPCKSNTKFHITIGHTTVNATAVFFGKNEILEQIKAANERSEDEIGGKEKGGDKEANCKKGGRAGLESTQSSLSASYHSDFPKLEFLWDQDFLYQDELEGAPIGNLNYGSEPFQWALLQFQQPVYCPLGSLIIGSRLESIEGSGEVFGGGSQHCRLSFYGPIVTSMAVGKTHTAAGGKVSGPNPLEALRLYRWKQKDCNVHRLIDVRGNLCHEAIGHNLYSKEAGHSIRSYLGMKLETDDGALVGVVQKAFGSTNKFRIRFPYGAAGIRAGMKLFLRFKRYVYDSEKLMRQTGMELTLPAGVSVEEGRITSGTERGALDNDQEESDEDGEEDSEGEGSEDGNGEGIEGKEGSRQTSSEPASVNVSQQAGSNIQIQSSASGTGTCSVKKSIGISLPPPSSTQPTSPEKATTKKTVAAKPTSAVSLSANKPSAEPLNSHPSHTKSLKLEANLHSKETEKEEVKSKAAPAKKTSYAALNLATLGQKRVVTTSSSALPLPPPRNKQSVSSGQPSPPPLSSTETSDSGRKNGKSVMSWASHVHSNTTSSGISSERPKETCSNLHSTGHENRNHSSDIGSTSIRTGASHSHMSPPTAISAKQATGPALKSGYQQHILDQMQATSPFLSSQKKQSTAPTTATVTQQVPVSSQRQRQGESQIRNQPPPKISPVSNLSYNYSHQPSPPVPVPPSSTYSNNKKSSSLKNTANAKNLNSNANCDTGSVRIGTVESLKQTAEGEYVAIVTGAFRMEENIRIFAGAPSRGRDEGIVGELLGPFAKMGKCKVKFDVSNGGDGEGLPAVKSKVYITLPSEHSE